MEQVRESERLEIQDMTTKMYHKSQDMQKIQNEIESISEVNSKLEQDFENQVDKTNKNIKEAGQIINSIDSIYNICVKLATDQRKGSFLNKIDEINMEKFENGNKKEQEKFIKNVGTKLDSSVQHVSDLVEIFKQLKDKSKQQASMDSKKVAEAAKLQKATKEVSKSKQGQLQ